VVGDNPARLTGSLGQALNRSDIVITTGGLGPTVDDITMETIASFAGKRLVLNKTILKDLRDYFRTRNVKLPKESVRQAYIPEGIKWIRNKVGTAPGLLVEYHDKLIVCLPGPPRELKPMFVESIIPILKKISKTSSVIKSRTIKTTGLAESQVDGRVRDLLKLEPPTTVGIYAKLREVDLKIMTKAKNVKEADKAIAGIEKKIRSRLKDHIFGYDDHTLEDAVANILIKRKLTIAVAESCTGGLVSSRLTDVSGSSKYFMMGLVAYSNLVKTVRLGVDEKTLQKYGAVSQQVALEMANGVRKLAGSDIGVGITGIAGPTGGTKSKPVGLVYVALAAGKKKIIRELRFRGSREEIKFQASQVALDLLRKNL
jgi:nicotinamide-nucleotide amidase